MVAQHDDGSGEALFLAGDFVDAGGVAVAGFARWDGTPFSAVPDPELGEITALIEHDDGAGPARAVGGFFAQAGGVPAANVARWDGASWSAMGSFSNIVDALCFVDDGSGASLMGNSFGDRLRRWNGVEWEPVAYGPLNSIETIASIEGSNGPAAVFAGGFAKIPGLDVNGIFVHDAHGAAALGDALGNDVLALASYDDGSGPALFAGGAFVGINHAALNGLARWDKAALTPVGGGPGSLEVTSLLAFDGGPLPYCSASPSSSGCLASISTSDPLVQPTSSSRPSTSRRSRSGCCLSACPVQRSSLSRAARCASRRRPSAVRCSPRPVRPRFRAAAGSPNSSTTETRSPSVSTRAPATARGTSSGTATRQIRTARAPHSRTRSAWTSN